MTTTDHRVAANDTEFSQAQALPIPYSFRIAPVSAPTMVLGLGPDGQTLAQVSPNDLDPNQQFSLTLNVNTRLWCGVVITTAGGLTAVWDQAANLVRLESLAAVNNRAVWQLNGLGNGHFAVNKDFSGHVFDILHGRNVQVHDWNNGSNERFTITPV